MNKTALRAVALLSSLVAMNEENNCPCHKTETLSNDEWLKDHTWVQEDGSFNPSRFRERPKGLAVTPREREYAVYMWGKDGPGQ